MQQQQLELLKNLRQFNGTTKYFNYGSVLLTDGVKYLVQHANASWLTESIRYFCDNRADFQSQSFIICNMSVTDQHVHIVFSDGNNNIISTHKASNPEFPLSRLTLYIIREPHAVTILLPSEY